VIRAAWRGITGFFGSAKLALGLLVFGAAWSAVGTMIPQADVSGQSVAAWAASHPSLEPIVRVLGLHQAFAAPIFVVCVLVLALSTTLCAWRRTRVAAGRVRALRSARRSDRVSLVAKHDLEVPCGPGLDVSTALSRAAAVLEDLGFRPHKEGDMLRSVSPAWSAWGSPVFHWALVAFIVVLVLGNLQRSSGLMGVAVGETKTDVPASYGLLHAGPLRDWNTVHRSFRVDSLDPDFRIGALDYGPAPTVSVLNDQGRVIKTQLVYPNMPLQIGALTVHAPADGFAAEISLVDTSGTETAHGTQLIDFSADAPGGTASAGYTTMSNQAGVPEFRIAVSVPLDRSNGTYVQALPASPSARVTLTTPGGQTVLDRVVQPGENLPLPLGGTLRVVHITWYARLSVVDDWTIPLMYAALAMAFIGLTITAVSRQQYVLATVIEASDGSTLVLAVRLWRNASTSRDRIVEALAGAFAGTKEDGDL
jgi:hypothetical protein